MSDNEIRTCARELLDAIQAVPLDARFVGMPACKRIADAESALTRALEPSLSPDEGRAHAETMRRLGERIAEEEGSMVHAPECPFPKDHCDCVTYSVRPKSTAWTDEERAAIADQREVDNGDAYARGADGRPLRMATPMPGIALVPCTPDRAVDLRCAWYDEDYDDATATAPMPESCTAPATHWSCCYNLSPCINVCEAHRCRCKQPSQDSETTRGKPGSLGPAGRVVEVIPHSSRAEAQQSPGAISTDSSGSGETPEAERRRVRDLAVSLARKLPFVAPELLREKIEAYLWTAYEVGRAAPFTSAGEKP